MLGKNNFKERLRKMEMQQKQDRFSIRKLTIGAASVLLGFTFLGLGSQTVKADTDPSTQQVDSKTETKSSESDLSNAATENNKAASQPTQDDKQTKKTEKEPKLSTFSGLSSFLKSSDEDSKPVSKAETAKGQTKKDSKESDQSTAAKQPDTGANDANAVTPGKTDATGKDTNTDITSGDNTASDGKLPGDSQANVIKPGDDTSNNDEQNSSTDKIAPAKNKNPLVKDAGDGISYKVYNWKDFQDALNNINITEIILMNDISANPNNGNNTFDVPGRTLLIRSNGNAKYKLDFTGYSPKQTGRTNADVTYQSLNMRSGDFYGVWNTDNVNGNYHANIMFKDCSFEGSQLIYAGSNTHIFFTGNNDVHTAKWPNRSDQQMFEFTGGKQNDSIEFLDGEFTGSTYGGSIIEMKGTTNTVKINRGATVTLNPVQDFDGNGSSGEWGFPYSAIYIENGGNVQVSGVLNINIGLNKVRPYKGKRDAGKARAVYLKDSGSTFNILQNGQVNINTNGNITDVASGNLFYDNGNLNISPNGELNVLGSNMGDYSGTLVYITGSADVENGGFNIRLGDDPGVGAIKLLDVQGGTLKVNNPTSFILDSHKNANTLTSIIGNNKITITNVRQQLQTNSGSRFTLPPFHVLQLQKSAKGISVNTLEMLDGNKTLTQEQLDEIKNDPAIKDIINDRKFGSFLTAAEAAVKDPESNRLDDIIKNALENALSSSDSDSYNNVTFVPANPSGFLDIDDDNLQVIKNNDGSRTIKGKVKNYTEAEDGPSNDNAFYKYFPKGTKGYVIIRYVSSNAKYNKVIQEDKNLKPYADTNDTYRGNIIDRVSELPTVFTSAINPDGTFAVTIPADITLNMNKGDKVEITPNANFVEYSPEVVAVGSRPIVKSIDILTLSEAQDDAATTIRNAVKDAENKKPTNLKESQSKTFEDELAKALAMADSVTESNKDTTVYGADTIAEVNRRKGAALDLVNKALQIANEESAEQDKLASAKEAAKQALENELNGNGTSGMPGVVNQIADLANSGLTQDNVKIYQDQAQKAYDAAKKAIDDCESFDEITKAQAKGVADIDQALTDAKAQQLIDKAVSDLKTAKEDALKELAAEKATVKDNIANLKNISTEAKTAFNKEVETYYQDAVDKVNNPSPASLEQVDIEKNTGIRNIDSVWDKATALDKEIAFDQKKLDDYAQAAADRINKTDMSEEDKQKAVTDINKARDEAKINVGKQLTSESADKAEDDGEKAIKAVEDNANAANIEAIKTSNTANVNAAADSAIERVNKAYNSLTEAGQQEKAAADKAAAIAAINQAKTAANESINAATTKDAIFNAFNVAKDKFDNAATTAEVAFAKIAAVDAVKKEADSVKPNLSAADQQTVDGIVAKANSDFQKATTVDKVNSIKDQAIKDIANVKTTADVVKEAEIKANKDTQTANIDTAVTAAKKRITDAYNKLSQANQTSYQESLQKALDDIDQAAKTAKNNIQSAQNVADIITAAEKGTQAIAAIETKTEVTFAQADAKEAIANEAAKVKPNLSAADQQTVDGIVTTANGKIDAATDIPTINNIKNQAIKDIDQVKTTADSNSKEKVEKAKELSRTSIDDAAKAAVARVEAAYRNLTPAEQSANKAAFDQAVTAIKNAQTTAEAKIAAATTETEVAAAASEGTTNINKLADAAELNFVKITANDAVQAEAGKVKPNLKETADQNKVDEIVDQAKADIGAAETVDNVNRIKENAIKAIDNVKSNAEQTIQKAQELSRESVDAQADDAKKRVKDAYDKLTSDEQKTTAVQTAYNAANNAIDKAKTVAETAIAAAQTNSEITTAVDNANKAFTQSAADAELAFAKVAAMDAVQSEADKVKKGLKQTIDLNKVDSIVTQAQTDLNNADSVTKVGFIKDQAIKDIDNVKTTADAAVDNSQTVNKANIDKAAAEAIQRVQNAYNELSAAEQEQAKSEYNKAVSDINEAKNSADAAIQAAKTVDDATNAATAGISTVNDIANKAELSFAKLGAKTAVKAAADAVTNGLDDKNQQKVQEIVTTANSKIDKATTITDVVRFRDQAINDINGVKAVADAVQEAQLNENKKNNTANVNEAADAARKRVDDAYNKLNDSQKNANHQTYQNAYDAIDNAANSANNQIALAQSSDQISEIVKTAKTQFDNAATKAEVAFAKVTAVADILNEANKVKQDLKADADKNRVDNIATTATTSINSTNTDTVAKVTSIRDQAIKDIDAVRAEANGGEQASLEETKSNRTGDVNKAAANAKARVDTAYAQLTPAEQDATKQTYTDTLAAIENTRLKANSDIASAETKDAVSNIAATAEQELDQEATKAEVAFAKTAAKDAIQAEEQSAIADLKGQDDKTSVQNIANNAIKEIDQNSTDTVAKVNSIKDSAISAIKAVKNTATAVDQAIVEEARKDSTANINEAAEAAKKRVEAAYNKLTGTEQAVAKQAHDDALSAIASAQKAANDAISSLNSKAEITQAANEGINKIDAAANEAEVAFAKVAAKDAVHEKAKSVIDQLNKSDDKKKVQEISDQADKDIDATGADTVDKVNSIRDKAINDVSNVKATADDNEQKELEQTKESNKASVDDLVKAAKKRVQDAYDKLGKDEKVLAESDYNKAMAAITQAQTTADDAISAAINADAIVKAVGTASTAFDTAATTAEVAFARVTAKTAIQAEADKVKKGLKQEVDQAKVDNIVLRAENDLAAAVSVDNVNTIAAQAIKDIDAVKDTAEENEQKDLAKVKDDSKQSIDQAATAAKQRIKDAYNTLSADEQAATKKDYDKAIQAITDAQTAAQVAIEKATDKDAVSKAVGDADQAFTQAETEAKLAFAKVAAKDTVHKVADTVKGNLSKDADKKQVDVISTQADTAIDKATDITTVNQLRDKAISDINAVKATAEAVDKATLEQAKDNGKTNVNGAAADAKKRVENAYNNLNSDQKNDNYQAYQNALTAIDNAADAANIKIGQAQTADEIKGAVDDAKTKFNDIATKAEVAFAKVIAKAAVQKEATKVKNDLKSQADKNKVDGIVNQANIQFNDSATDTVQEVNSIRDKAIDDIDAVKDAANGNEQASLEETKNNQKGNINSAADAAKARVEKAYNDLEKDQQQKTKQVHDNAITAIENALQKAIADIQNAETKDAVVAIAATAEQKFDQEATKAEVDFAKVAAKDAVHKEAANAQSQLKNAADKQKVQNISDQADTDFDDVATDTVDKVNSIKENAISAINAVKNTASAVDEALLEQARKDSTQNITNAADAAKKQVEDAYEKLSSSQKAATKLDHDNALTAIENAQTAAIDAVNAATSKDAITSAANDGVNKINAAATTAEVAFAKTAAKDAVQAEAANVIKNLKDKKDQETVQNIADTAVANIDSASNDTVQKVNDIRDQAINDIDKVKNTVDTAEQAKLEEAKDNSQASVAAAAAAATKRVEDAYNKLSSQQQTKTKADHDAAITAIKNAQKAANDAIAQAKDKGAVAEAVSTANTAFDQAATQAEVAFARAVAKEDIRNEADKIESGLSLESDKAKVEGIVNEANTQLNTADTVQKINDIRDQAISDIDSVKTNADQTAATKLDKDKKDAITALTNKQTEVKNGIDSLKNVSAENKTALKDKVDRYYEDAVNKIKDAGTTTSDQVNSAKQEGIDNMGKVLEDAKALDTAIANDQKKLDDHASAAIDKINKSDLSDADKEKAIESINKARDDAKDTVASQPTVEKADAAEKAGESAIDTAEKTATDTDLGNTKLTEKTKVEAAADNAKKQLDDDYNKLTLDQQKEVKDKYDKAKADIDQAKADAEKAIDSATSKQDVNNASDKAKTDIDKAKNDAELAFAQAAAKDAVKVVAEDIKSGLNKQEDKNKVDDLVTQANKDIDAATTIDSVNSIRDKAITAIKGIKNSADQSDKDDLAAIKSTNKTNVDQAATNAKNRVDEAYNKLDDTQKATTKTDYDNALAAIEDAKKAAETKIDSATNADAVAAAVDNASRQFDSAAATAELAFSKVAAKDEVNKAASTAKPSLSKDNQDRVDEIAKQASVDIDSAETVANVARIKQNAIDKINALKGNDEKDLAQAISDAKAELSKKHDDAVARLKDKFGNDADTTEVDKAFNSNKDITGASVDEVKEHELAAERELAKGEVQDTGTNAKKKVDELKHKDGTDYTQAEKDAIKNQIDKDVHNAIDKNGTIDQASDSAGVDKARKDAIDKIIGETIPDSQEVINIINQDKEVLSQRLAKIREAATTYLKQKFGPDTDDSAIQQSYEDALAKLKDKPTDLATELEGEKLIAKGALADAQKAANKRVDSDTNYDSSAKTQIKQTIQKDYNDLLNSIEASSAVSEIITAKRNLGIDQLYRDATEANVHVTNIVENGGGAQTPGILPNQPNKTDDKDKDTDKKNEDSERVVLMHNAYLYDGNGKRANGITLGAGSILDTYGIETINGDQYYVLIDKGDNDKKYYVAVGNIKSTTQKLKHNAYIYDQYGKRVKKSGKLKTGKAIATYGSSVKIRGKKYFTIAKNRYIKGANIASQDVLLKSATAKQGAAVASGDQSHILVNKKVMHNAYLYDQKGIRANGLIINAGSTVDVVTQKVVNKKIYYVLEDGLYIAAGNIDSKKLKLKRNAYIYNQYGSRVGKKVLKKHKSVKTYGNPVKIKGKKYYTVAKNKFVKKANIKG